MRLPATVLLPGQFLGKFRTIPVLLAGHGPCLQGHGNTNAIILVL
jgi:hypothetical protein